MRRGDVIQDRYELTEPLGEGGMAAVWRARDRRLHRDVAIKALAERLAQDPEYMVRFFSEAQSVARISNPHVIGILDFGQHEEHPYLVMECIEGGSAADLIGDPVLPERATEIVHEAAAAAGAAHGHGIVHRDIKPGNILLTRDGQVRLADFGIATSATAESMTATGQAIGSPHYISPEQVSGESATPASDVYSLGIVFYELLTGHKPIDGTSITQIAIAHVDQEPDPPSVHVPDLDPGLDGLVMKCLAKDPADRFADGRELADALGSLADGSPYVDEDEEGVEPVPLWRRPAVIGAAAIAALLLGVAVLALGGLGSTTPAARGDTEEDERATRKPDPTPTPTSTSGVFSGTPSPTPSPTESDRPTRSGAGGTDASTDAPVDTETSPEPASSPTPTVSPTAETGEPPATGETTTDEATSTDETTSTETPSGEG